MDRREGHSGQTGRLSQANGHSERWERNRGRRAGGGEILAMTSTPLNSPDPGPYLHRKTLGLAVPVRPWRGLCAAQ